MHSPEDQDLTSLFYRSTAIPGLRTQDLEHILARSRQRNAEESVSGILLYAGGKFMQYIEGPQAGLVRIFAHIQRSPFHTDIVDLKWKPIDGRVYGDWSMAFLSDGDGIPAKRAPQDPALVQELEARALQSHSPTLQTLYKTWNHERH